MNRDNAWDSSSREQSWGRRRRALRSSGRERAVETAGPEPPVLSAGPGPHLSPMNGSRSGAPLLALAGRGARLGVGLGAGSRRGLGDQRHHRVVAEREILPERLLEVGRGEQVDPLATLG